MTFGGTGVTQTRTNLAVETLQYNENELEKQKYYRNVTKKLKKYDMTLLLIPFLSFMTFGDTVLFPYTQSVTYYLNDHLCL